METLLHSLVPLWLGLAFACGINSYAVLLWSGLFLRWGWSLTAADHLAPIATPLAIGLSLIGLLLEWRLGKPRVSGSLWDAVHALVRPATAAGLTLLLFPELDWPLRLSVALVGAGIAFAVHSTKASLRFAAAAVPDSRWLWLVSVGEEGTALMLVMLAWFRPVEALLSVSLGGLVVGLLLPRVLCAFMRAAERTLNHLLSR